MHVCVRARACVCVGGGEGVGGGLKQYSLAYSRASRWLWQCSTAHFRSFGVRGLKDIYSSTCQAISKPEIYLSQYMYLPGCFTASDISTAVRSHLYQKLKKYLQQYTYEPLLEPFIAWRVTTASPASLLQSLKGDNSITYQPFCRASWVTSASPASLFQSLHGDNSITCQPFSEPEWWHQHQLPAFFRASRVTTASPASLFQSLMGDNSTTYQPFSEPQEWQLQDQCPWCPVGSQQQQRLAGHPAQADLAVLPPCVLSQQLLLPHHSPGWSYLHQWRSFNAWA